MSRPRPTVGILTDWLEEKYQTTICAGIEATAQQRQAGLIYFIGGSLNSPHSFEAPRNVVYDLAGAENIDGLIILAAALCSYSTAADIQAFCRRYHPLPMVSLSLAMAGIPSVLVDNQQGLRALLVHLIEDHGYRRLAFIGGPETNPEALARYQVYRDCLNEYGLPVDPQLVVNGAFRRFGGSEAIRLLVDERRADFQAIVAANDEMAIGALEALQTRGIRVPEDIAVCGFDDIKSAAFTSPPLTTVHQPLHQQGQQAAEHLLDMLTGAPVPSQTILPAVKQVRRSCGCAWPPEPAQAQLTQTAINLQAEQQAQRLYQVSQVLMTTFDFPQLLETICQGLRQLEIERFYLVLYDGQPAPSEYSRLILAYDTHGRRDLPPDGQIFPTRQLVPEDIWPRQQRRVLIVEPIFFHEDQFGFAVLEKGSQEGYVYEALCAQVSNALKGALLVRQVQAHATTLEAEVDSRTAELIRANAQLQQEIAERTRAEALLARQAQELTETRRRLAEAREAERLRMAQDLHDGAVQQLIGISYQIEALRRQATEAQSGNPHFLQTLIPALQHIRRQVLGVSGQLRSLIGELRPVGLKELGLLQALTGYVDRLERESGDNAPEITLDLPENHLPDLPEMASTCIFRAAQEALRNALQHSGGRTVCLSLQCTADTITLSVRDDGIGFQVPPHLSEFTRHNHFGLAGIAERVDWTGGQLTLNSKPGGGTEVIVCLPLNKSPQL